MYKYIQMAVAVGQVLFKLTVSQYLKSLHSWERIVNSLK